MTKKKTEQVETGVYTETADDLYRAITEYTPTKTEAQRMANWQKEKADITARINELSVQGEALLRGFSAADVMGGYIPQKTKEKAEEIKREIDQLKHELHLRMFMPCVDDEYISICRSLEEVTAQRIETETRYEEAVNEYTESRGRVPFELYKKTEQECYDLSAEVDDQRKREQAVQDQKAKYVQKADALLDRYQRLKSAEVKAHVLESVNTLREYLTASGNEMKQAESITLAWKDLTLADVWLPIPFGGDTIRHLLKYLEEVADLAEREL